MVSKRWPWRRSTFREANRVSLDALSQQLPLRLIEAVMPHFRSRQLNSWLAYWLPRSLWKIGPAFSVGTAPQPGHLQCIDDQIALHLRFHRPAPHPPPETATDTSPTTPPPVRLRVGDIWRLVRSKGLFVAAPWQSTP